MALGEVVMNNKLKFTQELIVTLIIASLFTVVVGFIFVFTALNLGADPEWTMQTQRTILGAVWGLCVGYRLHTVIQRHRR